ncbi:response regulator [Vibrio mexicanus]|uniref:response regulator n=1 Tax=Vibrio mexicanus TaxID=1004326 RepID=UPI00063C8737|nr:response regulator [Vibrio mexicanus]
MQITNLDFSRPALIVDDSAIYRTATKSMLQKLGWDTSRIHFAQDALEAITQCRTHNFGLIFADYNLGKKANGYQLIDELLSRSLITPDCTTVIVTGDATPEVVKGFIELNPDGYLLKPVNYSTLKQRLPQFAKKKQALAAVLVALSQQRYSDAIMLVDRIKSSDEDILAYAQLLKSKALIELHEHKLAQSILMSLQSSPERDVATLEHAKLKRRLKAYPEALYLLDTLEDNPLLSPQIDEARADIYADQNQYQLAIKALGKAIEASPKSITRLSKQVAYLLANNDFSPALAAIKKLIQQSKHSFRNSIQPLYLGASIQLDLAQQHYASKRDMDVVLINQWVSLWRDQYPRNNYRVFELLLFARASLLQGHADKAQKLFQEFLDEKLLNQELSLPTVLKLELVKVAYLLKDDDLYRDTVYSLNEEFSQSATDTDRAMMCYLAKVRVDLERKGIQVREVKSRVNHFIQNQQYDRAITLLTRPLLDQFADAEIHMLTLQVLTHCWPTLWRRGDVIKLVMKCKARLRASKLSDTIEYYEYCTLLSSSFNREISTQTCQTRKR